ncbi:MAG TPA: DUF167 domain-containing protein [bacterium]|nr:DUF167 domain-containing protein [bacterium]HPQ65546.1 DUF167 domain-containing protein [bacterium]
MTAGKGIKVRLRPGAARDRVAGPHGDAIRIEVTARAVEEKANRALVRFLSRALGIPRSAVSISAGRHSRDKLVRIEGMDPAAAAARLLETPGAAPR